LGIVSGLLLLVLVSVAPVNRTPVEDLFAYKVMMERLDTLTFSIPKPKSGFSVGFGKVNITPDNPTAFAGYGSRLGKSYTGVHDSIFVRTLFITNGIERVAIVSADLLIIPPTVTRILDNKLHDIGFSLNNTYLGATHSHNSIGSWGEGATRFIYGPYDDTIVNFIADAIVKSIVIASGNTLPATIRAGAMPVPDAVQNRLIKGGNEDPFLRAMEVVRSDSSKLVLLTYAAHATCLFQKNMALSRDYPGMLVDKLESDEYRFAMFMAGGVGSHRGSSPEPDWACVEWMADEISSAFLSQRELLEVVDDSVLVMKKIPLELGDPQVKILPDWKLRAWVFRTAFREYDSFLTLLRVGDVVMSGTPCDFSGEFNASIDSVANAHGLRSMVTSFNGGYIGYVTPRKYYEVDHNETQLMNWYAPGTGDYMANCLETFIVAVSDPR
jgi:hypothetical protein